MLTASRSKYLFMLNIVEMRAELYNVVFTANVAGTQWQHVARAR